MSSYLDITLIRHGQTDWNLEKKMQGHSDIPLNKEGEEQALKLKGIIENKPFDAVFSSDLSRAYKTASIALEKRKAEIIKTEALRERFMGGWEGQLIPALIEKFKPPLSKDEYLSYKGDSESESYDDVYTRLRDFIYLQREKHQSILLSSHGGVMRAVLYQLDFHSELKWQVPNCSWIKLRCYQDGAISIVERDESIELRADVSIPF